LIAQVLGLLLHLLSGIDRVQRLLGPLALVRANRINLLVHGVGIWQAMQTAWEIDQLLPH
jgi:hypothetical protein